MHALKIAFFTRAGRGPNNVWEDKSCFAARCVRGAGAYILPNRYSAHSIKHNAVLNMKYVKFHVVSSTHIYIYTRSKPVVPTGVS